VWSSFAEIITLAKANKKSAELEGATADFEVRVF
jgi:hypothetical protein